MDNLSAYQLDEWEASDKLDPIGTGMGYFMWAAIMAQITNLLTWAHAKKGQGTKYTALDFMPNFDELDEKQVKVQGVEEMKKMFMEIAAMQNKRVKRSELYKRPPTNLKKQ